MAASPLARLVKEFSGRAELSPASRRYYGDSLSQRFLGWAEEEGIREADELTPSVVDGYARHLEAWRKKDGEPLALATRGAYLRALRQFLGWLRRRRGMDTVDERELALPGKRRKPREVLSPAEIQQLEDAAPIERDKLIIRVMADAGPREGEIVNLRITDLVERERRFHFLRFRGKTGERLTPISPTLYRRLLNYARGESGRPMRTGHASLFMSHRRRNGGDYAPLTEDGIYQVVRGAAERAGMHRRVNPHLFRHTRITAWVASGMNIVTVSEIAGVSIAVIAQHYTHQTDEQRHAAVMRVLDGA